jgi:hypothetical protein
VQAAIKVILTAQAQGSTIRITPNGNADYNASTSIFVKNIPEGTTLSDFYGGLSQFGVVIQSYVGSYSLTHADAC